MAHSAGGAGAGGAGAAESARPYSGDDLVEIDEVLGRIAERHRLTDVGLAGQGLEFSVHRAHSPDHGEVAVRIPRYRVYRLPEREPFSALRSLSQEYSICAALHERGFPVARPVVLDTTSASVPVLLSRHVATQRHGADSRRVGAMLAALHAGPPPAVDPVDHDGGDLVTAMGGRLRRRWLRLRGELPHLPAPPAPEVIQRMLTPAGTGAVRLLHLDIRACNILAVDGEIAALVDWTCAMIGHPAAELARVDEYAQLAENELDAAAIRQGYAAHLPLPTVPPQLAALLRLDAVAMLGVLFLCYVPDPVRAAWAAGRAEELTAVIDRYVRAG